MKITAQRDGHEVIDYERYTQHLITVFYNRITAFSSNQYLSKFGLGSVEMRVLAAIASHPLHKAADICGLISIDKAAASRALAKLEDAHLAVGSVDQLNGKPGKQKRWELTAEGWMVHREFLEAVKRRHQRVTAGIDEAELSAFSDTLHKLLTNIDQLHE